MTFIHLMFAGIWSQIWHWGIGVGLIILCLAGAYFTTAIPIIGPYLTHARKDFLWAAFAIAIFLGGQALGAADEAKKNAARVVVINKAVDKAVNKTKTPRVKAKRDPWDRTEY